MLNFFFYKCGMRHEEFSFSSNSADDISPWKRNPLCSVDIRSKNIFCTHGTAFLRIIEFLEKRNPELKNRLLKLQNQLFSIDHQKGELEKYVFEEDAEKKTSMLEEMKVLFVTYEKICDEIKALVSEENCMAELNVSQSFEVL